MLKTDLGTTLPLSLIYALTRKTQRLRAIATYCYGHRPRWLLRLHGRQITS